MVVHIDPLNVNLTFVPSFLRSFVRSHVCLLQLFAVDLSVHPFASSQALLFRLFLLFARLFIVPHSSFIHHCVFRSHIHFANSFCLFIHSFVCPCGCKKFNDGILEAAEVHFASGRRTVVSGARVVNGAEQKSI